MYSELSSSFRMGIFLISIIFYLSTTVRSQINVTCPENQVRERRTFEPDPIVTWPPPTVVHEVVNETVDVVHVTHENGTTFGEGVTTIVYLFEDSQENTAFCWFLVEVNVIDDLDRTPPVIFNCPGNISTHTVSGAASVCWSEPFASDDSGVAFQVSFPQFSPGNFIPVGEHDIIYSFSDLFGNEATCRFRITVSSEDRTPPTVVCPLRIIQRTTDIGTGGLDVFFDEPSATDEFGITEIERSHVPGDFFPVGVTTVIYVFRDPSGNAAPCSFLVNVISVDAMPPVISSCPQSMITEVGLESNGTSESWREPTARDNSGIVDLIHRSHSPGEFFPVGSTIVSYRFSDPVGFVATCSFFITIIQVDSVPPVIQNCSDSIELVVTLEEDGALVFFPEPIATDNSGMVELILQTHQSGDFFPLGTTTVRYTFSDPAGIESACVFLVTVRAVDRTPPVVFNCPENETVVFIPSGSVGANVIFEEPAAFDNSGEVFILSRSRSPGYLFTIGTTVVTYVFTDASSNTEECSFNITVIEETVGVCSWRAITTAATGLETTVIWEIPFLTRRGEVDDVDSDFFRADSFEVGVSKVMSQHNQSVCVFSVIVEDMTPPTVESCPEDVYVQLKGREQFVAVEWEEPKVSDQETGRYVVEATQTSGDLFSEGVTAVNYTFTDPFDNKAFCSFNINITRAFDPGDSQPPIVFNCPNSSRTVLAEALSANGYRVIWQEPSASDNSGLPVDVTASHRPGDFLLLGMNTINYEFTDMAGNSASCSFEIIIELSRDIFGRFTACPKDISVYVQDSSSSVTVSWEEPEFMISQVTITQNRISGSEFGIGRTDVVYSAEQGRTLLDECRFSIIVNDVTPPRVRHCPTTRRIQACRGWRTTTWYEPQAVDNSDKPVSVFQTHFPGESLFPYGTTGVSYFFTDESGNTATCHFNVMVHKDNCMYFTPTILVLIAVAMLLIAVIFLVSLLVCRCSKKEEDDNDPP